MIYLLNNKSIKIIAITISICVVFQGIVWSSPDPSHNTLQVQTIFTDSGSKDSFSSLLMGYLVFFLREIENDPRNQNITRIREVVDSAVKELKDTKAIPVELKETIPKEIEVYQHNDAMIIDLGRYKIRYFNHKIPGSETPDIEEPGFSYEIIHQTQIGRYLSRQILKQKELPAPKGECPHGPALFIDPETGEVRSLREEPDEPGGISEHQAVNEAVDELVFKQHKEPLGRGDPLYDFVDPASSAITIYIVDDDALEAELDQKGFAYISEGLLTHAGTFRDPESRLTRASNMFIPNSVYRALLGLLETESETWPGGEFVQLWKDHEIAHFMHRIHEIDQEQRSGITRMARCILLLSKAERALGKGMIKEALEHLDEAYEFDPRVVFISKLRGQIYEDRRDWRKARENHFDALLTCNFVGEKLIIGHPFESKVLDVAQKELHGKQELVYELMIRNLELTRERYSAASGIDVAYFAFLPIAWASVARVLQRGTELTQPEMDIVEGLLGLVEEEIIYNPVSGEKEDNVFAYIYYLAGEANFLAEDFDKAVMCFEKSIQHDETLAKSHPRLAVSYVNTDRSAGSFERAYQVLEQAEERLGPSDDLNEALEYLAEAEEEISVVEEEAREQFEQGVYYGCRRTITELDRKTGKATLPASLRDLMNKSQELGDLKRRGIAFLDSRDYERAEECFDRISEENPLDEEVLGLKEKVKSLKEKGKSKALVREDLESAQKLLTQANNQVASGRIGRARNNYNKALAALDKIKTPDKTVSRMRAEIKRRLVAIEGLPDRVERVIEKPKKRKRRETRPTRRLVAAPEKTRETKVTKRVKRKAFLAQEVVRELTTAGTEMSSGNNQRIILNAIKRIANRTKSIERVEGTHNLMRARAGNFRIICTDMDSGDVLILSVVKKADGIYRTATDRFPDSFDYGPVLDGAVILEDFQKKLKDHGPALFIDPRTDGMRSLKEEPDEPGGISEHRAVNEVMDEVVFKRHKEPLERGDPLYDYVNRQESRPDLGIDIYVVDDDALEQELSRKGFAYIAEGLITHAGTYRDRDSREIRASNLFIPDSVYKILSGILQRKFMSREEELILLLWKRHEIQHFISRMAEIDAFPRFDELDTARILSLTKRAERALAKGRLEEALAFVNKVVNMDRDTGTAAQRLTLFFAKELQGRVNEARGDWNLAFQCYLTMYSMLNVETVKADARAKIESGTSLEEKLLDMLARMSGGKPESVNGWLMKFMKTLEAISQGSTQYGGASDGGISSYFGMFPVVCAAVDRSLEDRSFLGSYLMEMVDRLFEFAEKGAISEGPMDRRVPWDAKINGILSRVYYLCGEAYLQAGDFDKAIECFEKAIENDETLPKLHAKLAVTYVMKDRSSESFQKAEQVLEQAEERFGAEEVLTEAREYVSAAEEEINTADKKAHEQFKKGDYAGCRRTITTLDRAIGKAPLPADLQDLQEKSQELANLKRRGVEFFNSGEYEEAEKYFDQILEANPSDEEVKKLKESIPQLIQDRKAEKDRQTLVRKVMRSAETYFVRANNQVASGRIGSARSNYNKALGILGKAEVLDEAITKMIERINERLAAIANLPDRVDIREKEEPERKRRRQIFAVPEEEEEIEVEAKPEVVFLREIFFSKQAVNTLTKGNLATEDYQNRVLESMRQVSTGDTSKVDIDKITARRNLWRIRTGDIRIVFTFIDQAVLVLSVFKRARTYRRVFGRFTDGFDYGPILDNAIAMEDFEKQVSEGRTMKAPGSLSMDEDQRVDEKYIAGLVSRATERTGEVNISEAAAYINKHAPPFGGTEVNADKIKIYTIDDLGDKIGIPRFEGAEKAIDLIYEYGKFEEGLLKIYVTRQYFETRLKDGTMALAEFIDHEHTEKVLGYSHRVAASRSCKFIPEGGFLSPFHHFYIHHIISEGDRSLSQALEPLRAVSTDVAEAHQGNKREIEKIEAYDALFYEYLFFVEWIDRARKATDPGILADHILLLIWILKETPEIILTEEERDFYTSRLPASSREPAIFIDPGTDELRRVTEREAEVMNEVCKKLVSDHQIESLKEGNPVYEYIDEYPLPADIYVIDDDAFEEELEKRGYGYLSEGILTHADTYYDPDSRHILTFSIFIPDSVHKVLSGFLEKPMLATERGLLEAWRLHMIMHFTDQMDIFKINMGDIEPDMGKIVSVLSKAERALKKGDPDEAMKLLDGKAVELCMPYDMRITHLHALRERTFEALGEWYPAIGANMILLAMINGHSAAEGSGKLALGHILEDKGLDLLVEYFSGNQRLISQWIMEKLQKIEAISKGSTEYGGEMDQGASAFFGELPVICAALVRFMEDDTFLGRYWEEITDRLFYLAEAGAISAGPMDERMGWDAERNGILSDIYTFCGQIYADAKHYDKAIMSLEKAIQYEDAIPAPYATLAASYVLRSRSLESFEKAEQVLAQAEERFGTLDLLTKTRDMISELGKEIIQAGKKAREQFERGEYDECQMTISALTERIRDSELTGDLRDLQRKSRRLANMKRRGVELLDRGEHKEAEKYFDQILEENPSDEEVKKLKESIPQLIQDRKAEKDKQALVRKILRSAETYFVRANNQVVSGRIGSARNNYNKALKILREAGVSDEAITKMIKQVEERLAAIANLPDRVDIREKEEPERKRRRQVSAVPEEEEEIEVEVKPEEVFLREIFFSKRVVNTLTKGNLATEEYQNRVLESMGQVSTGDTSNVDIDKITARRNLWRIRTGDIRIVFTFIDRAVLVLSVFKRGRTYRRVFERFTDGFDYESILDSAITMEDFEKQVSEGRTMKAPGSLSMDEDQRVDEEHIAGLVSRATERTGEVNIREAAAYINKHAPPFDGAEVNAYKIKIYTIDDSDDKMGIPRFEGAKKAIDLIYEYGIYEGGVLKIYVTRQYFKTRLKDDTIALAEFIDHEHTEKVLGYSHRVAASRSYKFIPADGFLSPFHYFYINQMISEGDYSLSETLSYEREVSEDIMEAYEGNESEIRKVLAYERRFFDYLLQHVTGRPGLDSAENTRSWKIMENARFVIPRLIQAMIDASEKIEGKAKDEKVVLLLDTDLTKLVEKGIGKEIERLIRLLAGIENNNKDLQRFLANLEIVRGEGKDLLRKKGDVKDENIIVVTKSSNMECFKSIKGRAVIAAIEDKDLPESAYLPLLEVVLFAFGKYLNWDEDKLRAYYKNIPNVVPVADLKQEEYDMLFSKAMKSMIIKLIPDATEFNTQELVEVMARIREILSKA